MPMMLTTESEREHAIATSNPRDYRARVTQDVQSLLKQNEEFRSNAAVRVHNFEIEMRRLGVLEVDNRILTDKYEHLGRVLAATIKDYNIALAHQRELLDAELERERESTVCKECGSKVTEI